MNSINVVILKPLPVDPGDEPMSPMIMMKKSVAGRNAVKFPNINPQLLNDIAWKMELTIFNGKGSTLSVL